jgi:hypothetical protein
VTQFFVNTNKILIDNGQVKIRVDSNAQSTTTTTPAPSVAGYIVSGAGNATYNGTYCLDSGLTSSYGGSKVYKHQTNNMYIYYGGGYAWIGPVVGYIYADSDGYYQYGENDPLSSGGWSSSSCCGTELGSSPSSVTQTTCAGITTTTTTTTTTTAAPGGVVGYSINGNATTLGSASTGTYCDTGIRNSNGIPIYRKQLSPTWYAYLIRRSGVSSTLWYIVVSTSATQFSQNVSYLGDGSAAWYSNAGSGATPPSSGWIPNPGPPTSGSITSITETTCSA